MDPTRAVTRLHMELREFSPATPKTRLEAIYLLESLAEHVDGLLDWLRHDGFMPEQWSE